MKLDSFADLYKKMLTGGTNIQKDIQTYLIEHSDFEITDFELSSVETILSQDLNGNPTYSSESATSNDKLGRESLASAIAHLFSNKESHKPLIMGLFGDWGGLVNHPY